MQYIKVIFELPAAETGEVLIALLSDAGFEGFEEVGLTLNAFIPLPLFSDEGLQNIVAPFNVSYSKEIIEPQNWNEIWEAGIQPVVVEHFCTVKAHFHNDEVTTPYVVIITPKMSFGTGHHATTQLMMMAMQNIAFAGKTVLDFGTGTGVLAILAAKLGATDVTAIDNDSWSVENAIENTERNEVANVKVSLASAEDVASQCYDVILANINRHILLAYMSVMHWCLVSKGILLMSGLLEEDEPVICSAAEETGFIVNEVNKRNGWISVLATKR